MSPLAGLPGAPLRPGGPGLPGEAHVHPLASSQLKCLELVLEERFKNAASYLGILGGLFLQKGLGEKFLGSQGHLSLPLAQAFPWAQVDPFHADLNDKNSASMASMNLSLSPEKDPPLSRSMAEEMVGSVEGPNSDCIDSLVPEPHFLLMTYHTDQPQVCFLLGLCPKF